MSKKRFFGCVAWMMIVGAALSVETIKYSYDDTGRLSGVDYGESASITYTYDVLGNLLQRATTGGGATTYTLSYYAGTGGRIEGAAVQEVAAGQDGSAVLAISDPYYQFVQWSDGQTANPRTDTQVTENLDLTAEFTAVLASGGTPHWWLAEHGYTEDFDAAEQTDGDQDSFTARQEYVANTHPTNAASFLRVVAINHGPPVVVRFEPGSPARLYRLQFTDDLAGGVWTDIPGVLPRAGEEGIDFLTDTNKAPIRYYRVQVELP